MIQENEWYITPKAMLEQMFPIGYIFSWTYIDGSDVHLDTPERVHDYFGFGEWELYQPGVYEKCISAADSQYVDNSSVFYDGVNAPQIVEKTKYTVIDESARVYFISCADAFTEYLDKTKITDFPKYLPSTSTRYMFVVDEEGALYRYDNDETIDPYGVSIRHLIYPSRPIQGYYTVITPDGSMYKFPKSVHYDSRKKWDNYFIGMIDELPFTNSKYFIKYKESGDIVDLSNVKYKYNKTRKIITMDLDNNGEYDTEASYDSETGWYLIDDIQHWSGLLPRVYLIKVRTGLISVKWYEETFIGFMHPNERKILAGGPYSPKDSSKTYWLRPFDGDLLEAYRQGGFSSNMSPDAIYVAFSIDVTKTRVYCLGYDMRYALKLNERSMVWIIVAFDGLYEGDEKNLNFNLSWEGHHIREYTTMPVDAPTTFEFGEKHFSKSDPNVDVYYFEAYDDPVDIGIYYDTYLYLENANPIEKYVYGNVNLMKRHRLYWTKASKKKFAAELESWNWDPDEGSYSTVYGGCETFSGVDVAFTPIRQTSQGARLLDRDTVMDYITLRVARLQSTGLEWSSEDLYAIDNWGLIAGVGDDAVGIGEEMHDVSEDIETKKNRLITKGGNWTIVKYGMDYSNEVIVGGGKWNDHLVRKYEGSKDDLPEILQKCKELYEAYDIGKTILTVGPVTYAYYYPEIDEWELEDIPAETEIDDLPHVNGIRNGRVLAPYSGEVPESVGLTGIAGYFTASLVIEEGSGGSGSGSGSGGSGSGSGSGGSGDPPSVNSHKYGLYYYPSGVWEVIVETDDTPVSDRISVGGIYKGYKVSIYDWGVIPDTPMLAYCDAYFILRPVDLGSPPQTSSPSLPLGPNDIKALYLIYYNEDSPASYDEAILGRTVYGNYGSVMGGVQEYGDDSSKPENGYVQQVQLDTKHPLYKLSYHFYDPYDAAIKKTGSDGSIQGDFNLKKGDSYFETGLRAINIDDRTESQEGITLPTIPIRYGHRAVDLLFQREGAASGFTVEIEKVYIADSRYRRTKGNGNTGAITREVVSREYIMADLSELDNVREVMEEEDLNLRQIEYRINMVKELLAGIDIDSVMQQYQSLLALMANIDNGISSLSERLTSIENNKQDLLKFDDYPDLKSHNPVRSNGVLKAINDATKHAIIYKWRRVA